MLFTLNLQDLSVEFLGGMSYNFCCCMILRPSLKYGQCTARRSSFLIVQFFQFSVFPFSFYDSEFLGSNICNVTYVASSDRIVNCVRKRVGVSVACVRELRRTVNIF